MRYINLLPKKDRLRQYFILLLIIIVFVFTLAITVQSYYKYGIARDTNKLEAELAFVEAQIESQRQKFIPNERTVQYNLVSAEVERIEEYRRQWLADLVYILGHIPEETMVAQMGVDNNALLSAEVHFASVQSVLRFLDKLQAEPQFQSLKIEQLSKVLRESDPPDEIEPPVVTAPEGEQDYLSFIVQLFLAQQASNSSDASAYEQPSELEQALRANEQPFEGTAEGLSPFLHGDSPYTFDELRSVLNNLERVQQPDSEPEELEPVSPRKHRDPFVDDYYKLVFNIQLDPHTGRKAGD